VATDEVGARIYPRFPWRLRRLAVEPREHYTADTLKRVQELATGPVAPERFDEIPVAPAR